MPVRLRWRVLLLLAAATAASSLVAWGLTTLQLRATVRNELRQRAQVLASALEASVEVQMAIKESELAIPFGSTAAATAILDQLLAADTDLAYLVVVDANRTPVVWGSAPTERDGVPVNEPEARAVLLDLHQRRTEDALVRLTVPIKSSAEVAVLGEDEIEEPVERTTGASAAALIGLSDRAQMERVSRVILTAILLGSAIIAVLIWLFFSILFRRIAALTRYATRLATGDLTQRLEDPSTDELGQLGRALASVTQNLGETISRVRVAALEMGTVSSRVSEASTRIAGDATTEAGSVRSTAEAVAAMSATGQTAEAQIAEATRAAEANTERLRQISIAIRTIDASVQQLAAAVNQAETRVIDSVEALSGVDTAVDRLNHAAEGTASATTEIAASIRSVEASTEKASAISNEAATRARSGVEAVHETREGIDQIQQFTRRAVDSIHFLTEKVASVEQILDVIADIANQTRLLSLNASIIASQAGEHGRGFLVVADEIKALAAKTSGSTREIGAVITEVLGVSGKVIDVVEKGVTTVSEALARSDHATEVLSQIQSASAETGTLVRAIAGAMSEQARGAQRVDTAMQEVHATAGSLRDIVVAQKRAGTELQTSMQRMRELMGESLQTSAQQAAQVEQAIAAMGRVFEQVHRVGELTREDLHSREEVSRTFETLAGISQRHQESARMLAALVGRATAQADALTRGVQVFRV